MNLNLFFSDGTREYRNPVDVKPGDSVEIRFRVPAGCQADPVLHIEKGELPMELSEQGKRFDYYKAVIHVVYSSAMSSYKVNMIQDLSSK
jgi:hypothetical protein